MFSSAYAADNNVEPEDNVSISVSQNADFIEALWLSQPALFSLSNSSLDMEISNEAQDGIYTAILYWNEDKISMSGTIETIPTEFGDSMIGVFEGYANIDGVNTLIIADVNHAYNGDAFIVLTIGEASENVVPQVLAYGTYTNAIKLTYNAQYDQILNRTTSLNEENSKFSEVP